jgi:hypothetical protein
VRLLIISLTTFLKLYSLPNILIIQFDAAVSERFALVVKSEASDISIVDPEDKSSTYFLVAGLYLLVGVYSSVLFFNNT